MARRRTSPSHSRAITAASSTWPTEQGAAVVGGDEEQVIQRELALLRPEVRADAERVRALLHPDFVEFGASGRVWDRSSIAAVTSGIDQPITASELHATRLGPGAVLLTY